MNLSVRQMAKISGVSPATAHRAKSGKKMDLDTAKKFLDSGLLEFCPCCGKPGIKQIMVILDGNYIHG